MCLNSFASNPGSALRNNPSVEISYFVSCENTSLTTTRCAGDERRGREHHRGVDRPCDVGKRISPVARRLGRPASSRDGLGDSLHTSDGCPPRTFELAGKDGVFHPAQACPRGSTIWVHTPEVPRPMWVRYGWQPFTRANLVNKDGLPASTFQISVETPADSASAL